jgi:hypothetical protein
VFPKIENGSKLKKTIKNSESMGKNANDVMKNHSIKKAKDIQDEIRHGLGK